MRKLIVSFSFAALLAAVAGQASAQDNTAAAPPVRGGSAIGVGVEQMLAGPGGLAVIWDPGQFHIDGMLGIQSNGTGTGVGVGGRFLFVVARASRADLSVGGGLGFTHFGPKDRGESTTNFHLEGIAQIRAFIVDNVALSAALGMAASLLDRQDDEFLVGGQFLSSIGLAYYFR